MNFNIINIILFKSLIYLFSILFSYKLATAVAVSFGFFPKAEIPLLAMILISPLYLSVFIPIFLIFLALFILLNMFFAKKIINFSKNFTLLPYFIFLILIGLIPYFSLSVLSSLDVLIEKNREEGYVKREENIENNRKRYEKKERLYAEKLLNFTREEALALVKKDGSKLKFLKKEFKNDKEIVYAAVKQKPYEALMSASIKFRTDIELLSIALEKNAYALCATSKELKKNKKLVEIGINAKSNASQVFVCADKSMRKDKELILKAIESFPLKALHMAHSSLKDDREVVLASVRKFGFTLGSASSRLKKDRELVLEAVKQSGFALDYVDRSLKNDREIVVSALKSNGDALRYATDEQKADKELVLIAVKNTKDYQTLRYANIELTDDKEVALAAVKHNGLALDEVSMRLKHDKEIIYEALKENKHAMVFVPRELKGEFKWVK